MTRITETSNPLNYNEYLEWRDTIGDFMMSFARAEFIIMRGLIENTNLSFEDIKEWSFKQRIQKLRKHTGQIKLNNALGIDANYLEKIIANLIRLNDTRNLIAHNPVDLALDSLFGDKPYLEIRSPKNIAVTLEQLAKRLNELNKWEYLLTEAI